VTSRYNRIQQGSGCPLCGAKAGGMKIRLNEKNAINRLKEYNLEPLEPYKKSDVKWKCKCNLCGRTVYPKLKNLQRGDGGCFKCGKKKAGEKNKLSE
jgi:formylmethanofuran dehydrogenase subunit E